jgi:hypothetical protein
MAVVELVNTTVKFGAVGNASRIVGSAGASLIWRDTPNAIVSGSAANTGLINNPTLQFASDIVLIDNVDFAGGAGLGSNPIISQAAAAAAGGVRFFLNRCKLPSGASVVSGDAAAITGFLVDYLDCDTGGTNYVSGRYRFEGHETTETTIVRTGGSTDGTQPQSRKVVTNTNCSWLAPFAGTPIIVWVDSIASVTVTMYGVWGGGAVPNDDDCWIDVDYLSASGSSLGSKLSTTKANALVASSAVNNSSDSSTWGGSTTVFKMQATFTPGQKGPIQITPKFGKAVTTFYIDPRPFIPGVTIVRTEGVAAGMMINEFSSTPVAQNISYQHGTPY